MCFDINSSLLLGSYSKYIIKFTTARTRTFFRKEDYFRFFYQIAFSEVYSSTFVLEFINIVSLIFSQIEDAFFKSQILVVQKLETLM